MVDPLEVMDRVQARRLDRGGQMAVIAARDAWADAGGDEAVGVEPERLGVVVASGIGGITTLLSAYDTLNRKGARFVSPLAIPMLMPNGPGRGDRPGADRPRRRAHAGQRLRLRRRGDRDGRGHDP